MKPREVFSSVHHKKQDLRWSGLSRQKTDFFKVDLPLDITGPFHTFFRKN